MDALDLVQFYWHDYGVEKYVGAAQRLAELQEAGLIRHVGVTNFDAPRLAEIIDAGVRVVSNQVRQINVKPFPFATWPWILSRRCIPSKHAGEMQHGSGTSCHACRCHALVMQWSWLNMGQ